ncbi:hypothetical protein [Pseudomonas anguilliseptica]|uniref:hypothetical protein n=1 Tax=Pseudomonas anguilliseptica TaxID=53406 RepID=UPI001F1E8CD1|nr:hypothetical protein [Pseudomonas anguilliseptica]MCE5365109.1 hypothetical protein [Pseudomonas anguilliseptica]
MENYHWKGLPVFNPFAYVISVINAVREIFSLSTDYKDSFRREAQRIIDAFKAHNLPPNEVMRLLPDGMLGDDPSVLERATTLKKNLKHVSPWVASTLQLDPHWIKGRSDFPHKRVSSYKHFAELKDFFEAKQIEDPNMDRFVLHVFKADDAPMDKSQGRFVVVLEEHFAELDDQYFSRFFYLSHGHDFDNPHALLNLLQIMALAFHYGIHSWGRVMKPAHLHALDEGRGFIPLLWREILVKSWYPEDPLWERCTGDQVWNAAARKELEADLIRNGMSELVQRLQADRDRFAGKQPVVGM